MAGGSVFLSRLVANFAKEKMKEEQKNSDGKTVYLPRTLLVVGSMCTVFIVPALLLILKENDIGFGCLFLAFFAIGVTMAIHALNFRIEYSESGFTYRTILRRTYQFAYSDIEYIKIGNQNDTRIRVNNKTVFIDSSAVGRQDFIKRANEQYAKFNGGNSIPKKY